MYVLTVLSLPIHVSYHLLSLAGLIKGEILLAEHMPLLRPALRGPESRHARHGALIFDHIYKGFLYSLTLLACL
jgi:hypothetical protein